MQKQIRPNKVRLKDVPHRLDFLRSLIELQKFWDASFIPSRRKLLELPERELVQVLVREPELLLRAVLSELLPEQVLLRGLVPVQLLLRVLRQEPVLVPGQLLQQELLQREILRPEWSL